MRIVENVVKQVLEEYYNHPMKLKNNVLISDILKYHLEKKIPLSENVLKTYSRSFINLINEVRRLYNQEHIIQLFNNLSFCLKISLISVNESTFTLSIYIITFLGLQINK